MHRRYSTLLILGAVFCIGQVIVILRYLANDGSIDQSHPARRAPPNPLQCKAAESTSRGDDRSNQSARRSFIHTVNSDQRIVGNRSPAGLSSSGSGLSSPPQHVFVIQVHNRSENLRILLDSLARVKGIQQALVVLSMDFVSEELSAVVESFTAAATIRILFPHSIQLFPDSFPGTSPADCTGISSAKSKQSGCFNANWMDSYFNYRSGSVCQTKHHWLWKVTFVFDHLRVLQNYSGNIIFLEDDHYVVEDILHVLGLTEKHWPPSAGLGVLSLGNYAEKQDYSDGQMTLTRWVSSKHNLGLTFSRSVWVKLSQCLKVFCEYDDYNWDWSLQEMAKRCPVLTDAHLNVLHLVTATRVYHLGSCGGLHHSAEKNCSPRKQADVLERRLASPDVSGQLYPVSLRLLPPKGSRFKSRANGGWADPRDVALCESIASGRWSSALTQWAPCLTSFSPRF